MPLLILQSKKMEIILKRIQLKPKTVKSVLLEEHCFGKTANKRTISRPIAHELLEENIQRTKTLSTNWFKN